MCYSAMVKQDCKNLGMSFQARIDLELFRDVFQRRARGEKITLPKGLERSFRNPSSAIESEIESAISTFHASEVTTLETELFDLKKRLAAAEKKLKEKYTKTADKEKNVVLRQIERKKTRLENIHRSTEVPTDNQIFPFSWTAVMIQRNLERAIVPMRFHLRPPGKQPRFDVERPGCYNARRDNLSHFWKNQFGKKHGVIVITSFFENVSKHVFEKRELGAGEKEENMILQFIPTGFEEMYVPIIWDTWSGEDQPTFNSFAIITDEPPLEIAEAGHDRCPIFIKAENINRWLNPSEGSEEELFSILDDRVRPVYRHQVAV